MSEPTPGRGDIQTPDLTIKAGGFLFREGERATHLYLLLSGEVELVRRMGSGDLRVVLLGPGDLAGDSTLAGQDSYAMSARAVIDTTGVRLDTTLLAQLVRERPEIGLLAARRVAEVGHRLVTAWSEAVNATGASPAAARPTLEVPAPGPGVAKPEAVPTPALAAPRLVHEESGTQFPLPSDHDVLVGRSDPRTRFQPGIDLSGVDSGRSLSRRHAKVIRNGDEFAVVEEPRVANGTFVNGHRLTAGVPARIGHGDQVSFGLVRTVFRIH